MVSNRQHRAAREAADEAYRKALGLEWHEKLPAKLGAAASSGAARGGRGSSQSKKGKHRRKRKWV